VTGEERRPSGSVIEQRAAGRLAAQAEVRSRWAGVRVLQTIIREPYRVAMP
jgi:hypothetical protein